MIIHGRLAPGLAKPDEVLDLRLHVPHALPGVTLKLWDGETLLARWDGDLEPGGGATPNAHDYCKLTLKSSKLTSEDPELFAIRVRLPDGHPPVKVPLAPEKQELLARAVPLVFSLEQEGSEKFRSTSPCRVEMHTTRVEVHHHLYLGRRADRSWDPAGKREQPLTHQYVCFGLKNGEAMKARLEIVGAGWIDGRGVAVAAEGEDPQPLLVRKGRKLWAYVHDRKVDFAKGVSKIPIAACEEVGEDGKVIVERAELADQLEVRIAEVKVDIRERPFFEPDLGKIGGTEEEIEDEHLRAFAEAARRFMRGA